MIRFLQTPGPVKKIVLSGILLVFCGAMVITLIPGFGSSMGLSQGPGVGIVATVVDQQVTRQEVDREAHLMLRRQFPRGNPMANQLLPFFEERAAQQLIVRKTILAEAERMGFRATNADTLDELQHGQYSSIFFPEGKYIGDDAYEALLQQNETSKTEFEQSVRDEILARKLQNLITAGASVTDAEVQAEFEKRNTKVKFEYAYLTAADLRKGLHPTETELKAFYERNKAIYNNSIPEKRKIAYVVLDPTRIAAETTVSREELQAYYGQHRDEYRVPAQVNVRQIVIKTPLPGADGKVDPKALDAALKKAQDVAKQLKAGGKFEDLAKKYSEDPSSKNGGSLGWIQPASFSATPEVLKAVNSLAKGGTSDVINASYAFVIVHLDDRQDARLKPLDEVRPQIEPLVKLNKANRAAETQANALLSQARTLGLDKAAAAKKLSVVTTDFVSRNDSLPGIGASPAFMSAVFSQAEKSPPDMAQVPQGLVVFQVMAIKPPATPTFDEIRSRVEEEFKNERSSMLLGQKTQELSDRAKAQHDLKKAAKELGATMKTSDLVLPDGQVPDIGSMTGPASVAFSMKPGQITGPLNTGSNGAVLQILEKQEPAQDEFTQKKDQIRDSLLAQKQNGLFGFYIENLRQQMEKSGKIKINQEEMKLLTRTAGESGE